MSDFLRNLRYAAKQIKARVGVSEVAGWWGFEYAHNRRLPCPACHRRSTSRKTVQLSDDDEHWYCHSCNAGGDCISWVAARLSRKNADAIQYIAVKLGVDLSGDGFLAALRSALSDSDRPKTSAPVEREIRRETAKIAAERDLWRVAYADVSLGAGAISAWARSDNEEDVVTRLVRSRARTPAEVRSAFAMLARRRRWWLEGIELAAGWARSRPYLHERCYAPAGESRDAEILRLVRREARAAVMRRILWGVGPLPPFDSPEAVRWVSRLARWIEREESGSRAGVEGIRDRLTRTSPGSGDGELNRLIEGRGRKAVSRRAIRRPV